MEFRGTNFFLSNSFQSPFDYEIGGVTYRFQNANAAFQAERAPSRAGDFVGLTAKEATELGKKMKKKEIRPDFNEVRLNLMEKVLYAKFSNPALWARLWAVTEPITMDVNYMDRYWGLYQGRGQNNMGKCLTNVRERIALEKGLISTKEASVCCYKVQHGGMVTFDVETTGVSPKYDDILQITIAGQNGEILLSTYVKPQNCTSWEEAFEIHHISPEMVEDAPNAEKVSAVVKQIFDNADMIVGYNVPFDVRMVTARFGYDFSGKNVVDALPMFREYAKEHYPNKVTEDGVDVTMKLNSAIRTLFGEEAYYKFLNEAHDAEADTLATTKVAIALMEKKGLPIPTPHSMGAENLFGIEEGVLCNQVNAKGVVTAGFTKRLFYHHPEAKREFIRYFQNAKKNGEEVLGKFTITPCTEKDSVSIANIYAQSQVGNAEVDGKAYTDVEVLANCIKDICEQNENVPVYLPCIMSTNKGDFEVTDAIGCGKAGGKWEEIGPALLALKKDNLYLVDTTTGRCEKLEKDKTLESALEGDLEASLDEGEDFIEIG